MMRITNIANRDQRHTSYGPAYPSRWQLTSSVF